MSVLKKNVIANFSGSLWCAIMSLIFVPLYIHFIGIEAYGLVGVFTTLQVISGIMDMGLSATLNREIARLSVLPDTAHEMRDLVRTFEVIYWVAAMLISGCVIILAPFMANHWLQAQNMAPNTIQQAVIIMGVAIAFQWPVGLYSGGLLGLQRQVLLNVVMVGIATLRGAGAVLLLWLISPTVQAFFVWQVIISAANVLLVSLYLWHAMPQNDSLPRFRKALLHKNWRFAAGVNGIILTVTVLTQTDKVLLSRLLPLEMFGYYTLAWAVAGNLHRLYIPVFNAVYPRFTQLIALAKQDALKRIYHQGCQIVSILIIPPVLILAFFSHEILLLWTQNPVTANQAAPLVRLLSIGNLLFGLMSLPYALQLAYGWTKLAFYINILAILLLVPLMVLLVQIHGAVGAAWAWLILNAGYVPLNIYVMHRRLLPGEKWKWYKQDIGLPLLSCLIVAAIFRLAVPVPAEILMQLIYLFIVSFTVFGAAAMASSTVRNWIGSCIMSTLR